jgi:ABC-type Fe3+-siderophore transport system permease subunit
MNFSSKFDYFLKRFDLALRRISGIVFALMGLAWIGTILEGIRASDMSELAFAVVSMAAFLGLSWAYLSGPLSGAARRRRLGE